MEKEIFKKISFIKKGESMPIYLIGVFILNVLNCNALGPEVSPRGLPNGICLPFAAQQALLSRIAESWPRYPHSASEYPSEDLRWAIVTAYAELAILEKEYRRKNDVVFLFEMFKGFSNTDLQRLIKRGNAYLSVLEGRSYANDLISYMRYSIAYEQVSNFLKSNGIPASEIYQKIEDMTFSTQKS